MLDDKIKKEVKETFSELENKVKLLVFTQKVECNYCSETRELMTEIAEQSDKISVEVLDFQKDSDIAEKYGVDKIPATVVLDKNDKDYGIKFYGIPAGYEFATLVETVKMFSAGKADITEESKSYLDSLDKDVHLQVFVTPTCPYCPRAVLLAFSLALNSDKVKAEMVEASEFPHLSNKYNVMGVPRTIINENGSAEGAVPEQVLLGKIKEI